MDKIYEPIASFEEEWDKYTVKDVLAWNINHPHLIIIDSFLKKYFFNYKNHKIMMVDGGSGIGRLLVYYKQKRYTIYGVESVYSAVKKAKNYDPSLPLIQADLRRFPCIDNTYDVYLSEGVIEHDINGPDAILQEAKRVLKKDGLLFISIPIQNNFYKVFKPFITFFRNIFIENIVRRILQKPLIQKKEFHYYLYTKKEFEEAIKRNGFKILFLEPTMHIAGIVKICPFFLNRMSNKDNTGNSIHFLNRLGRILYYCTKPFPWLFPNSCFIVAQKDE